MFAAYSLAILLFCHHFIFRPLMLDWGATGNLREVNFSGDTLTIGGSRHTRAVLIQASPEEIWPWLTQIGQDRAGFYSYQWIENIFQADIKNAYAIKMQFQLPRREGDTVWLASKNHYQGRGYQIIAEITPLKSFVMVGGDDFGRIRNGCKATGTWAFYLYPESIDRTWLVARSSESDSNFVNRFLRYLFFEVPHFIMERKMLSTVRRLAESEQLTPDICESVSHEEASCKGKVMALSDGS